SNGSASGLSTELSVPAARMIPERQMPIGIPSSGASEWLHALRRRWLLALSLSITAGSGAAAAAWYLWQPEYTAFATIQIASHQPTMLPGQRDSDEQSSFEVYKRTQQELIRDRSILRAALRDDAVEGLPVVTEQIDPVSWLQRELAVTFPGDAEILQ